MLDSGTGSSGSSPEGLEKPKRHYERTQLGLVCGSSAVKEFYQREIAEGPDEVAFAVTADGQLKLSTELEALDKPKPVDAILVVAEPGMNVAGMADLLRDAVGEDTPVLLEDVSNMAGAHLQVVGQTPEIASTFTEVTTPKGLNPTTDAQAVLRGVHEVAMHHRYTL